MTDEINRRTQFESIDVESLLSPSEIRVISARYQGVVEYPCDTVEINGKLALAFAHRRLCDAIYEEIFRLTYAHYLCKRQESYTLYEWDSLDPNLSIKMLTIVQIQGCLTPQTILHAVSDTHPKAYESLAKLLYKDPNGSAYISHYRDFLSRIDDIFFSCVVQRVILNDDFSVSHFDVIKEF